MFHQDWLLAIIVQQWCLAAAAVSASWARWTCVRGV